MHKCIRCSEIYQENDASILRGCKNCGSIFFLYIKSEEHAKEIDQIEKDLEQKDTSLEKEISKQIEKIERREELQSTEQKIQLPTPQEFSEGLANKKEEKINFGIETVKIPREGIYEINLEALISKQPVVILERGSVYFIHLPSAFDKIKEK